MKKKPKLFEPSHEYISNYKAALEFHEAMCSIRKWLKDELKQKYSENRVKEWIEQHENQHKTKPINPDSFYMPSQTNSKSYNEWNLIANNLIADTSRLSPEEFVIFRLADVHYDRETKKMMVHFSLPSKFHYKAYVAEFMNQTMDKITQIWSNALEEIRNTESYKQKVNDRKKFRQENK